MFSLPTEQLSHCHKIYIHQEVLLCIQLYDSFSFNTYSYAVIWKRKKFLEHSRMKPVHAKEALSLLDRVHLFAFHNIRDGRLQHVIEEIINLIKGIIICSKKQTSSLFFFIVKWFLQHVYVVLDSRVKSVVILNTAYSLTIFLRKCLHILIERKKRQKA